MYQQTKENPIYQIEPKESPKDVEYPGRWGSKQPGLWKNIDFVFLINTMNKQIYRVSHALTFFKHIIWCLTCGNLLGKKLYELL